MPHDPPSATGCIPIFGPFGGRTSQGFDAGVRAQLLCVHHPGAHGGLRPNTGPDRGTHCRHLDDASPTLRRDSLLIRRCRSGWRELIQVPAASAGPLVSLASAHPPGSCAPRRTESQADWECALPGMSSANSEMPGTSHCSETATLAPDNDDESRAFNMADVHDSAADGGARHPLASRRADT